MWSSAQPAMGQLVRLATEGIGEADILDALLAAAREALPDSHISVRSERDLDEGAAISFPLPNDVGASRRLVVRAEGRALPHNTRARLGPVLALAAAALALRRSRAEARSDGLTGLLNRTAFDERLAQEVTRATRQDSSLACAVIDLDEFKRLNDTRGHLAGDALLQRVAEHLEAVTRPFDAVARFGGDEFVVLMPGIDREHVGDAAGRLLWAIREAVADHADRTGGSIGIAMHEPGMDAAQLLDTADSALREAKDAGGGSWVLTGAQTGPAGTPNGDLRLALGGDVDVLFQPVVDLATDGLVGLEALSRGPGSLQRPEALLEQARSLGRLVALDEELHRRAFQAADRLGLESPLSLFINIEPETLTRIVGSDRFWQRTARTFAALSEVTEQALMQRPGALLRGCRRLRELGWGIALDDVGVDPRALSLLPLVAPDVIKLDRRLIQNDLDADAIRALLACGAQAQSGGARILAEGIETDAHRTNGLALGAQFGQGYLFGAPEPGIPDVQPAAPVPRTSSPQAIRGMTPFHLLTAEHPAQHADEQTVLAVHEELVRRAAAVGPTALVACGLGSQVPPAALAALEDAGGRAGVVAALTTSHPDSSSASVHHGPLDPSEPAAREWTCALLTPNAAIALAAQPVQGDGRRWRFTISHDRDLVVATAHELVSRLR